MQVNISCAKCGGVMGSSAPAKINVGHRILFSTGRKSMRLISQPGSEKCRKTSRRMTAR
jgi:hypothetical protein